MEKREGPHGDRSAFEVEMFQVTKSARRGGIRCTAIPTDVIDMGQKPPTMG